MGLTKNYLRYVHESTFGIVASAQAGAPIQYLQMRNTEDRFIAVPASESVYFWDLKTKQIVNQLSCEDRKSAEVTTLACYHGGHPRTSLISVGYANGLIRVFEYETGILRVTFTGHRTAISALAFDRDGSRLASGGKDCNIVLWDITSERGLFSLKGHKNSISKLAFLFNEEQQKDVIVSSSIDPVSAIKFWDLQTQHCFCTIPGHSSGVWSFAILRDGTRLVTGSSSPELRVYSIKFISDSERQHLSSDTGGTEQAEFDEERAALSSETEYGLQVKHLGNILRNSTSISNRIQDIVVDHEETLMLCHSVDKNIELYKIRSPEESLTYAKKQAKKALRRQSKRKSMEQDDSNQLEHEKPVTMPVSLDMLEPQALVDCEFNRKLGCCKLSDKLKAAALTRTPTKDGSRLFKVTVMSSTNKIETYLLQPDAGSDDDLLKLSTSIGHLSHRTDVRYVSISSDNSLIMTGSAESIKIWRLDTRLCIATIETEYCNCCIFANAQNLTGSYENRYALVGTKQGHLQILDLAEAMVIQTLEICTDGTPLNSICLRPDKAGIVCGGEDKILRFYNYIWQTIDDEGQKRVNLSIEEDRVLAFQEGITCVNVSANNNLLAVALLDSTVRVHFMDSFKHFLTMYGHKFPVTAMDISDDSTLLATGSPDKNIKIWGLDFGDCHKSIFAHDDTITSVKFVPKSHYLFSVGRDRQIKQWDCDHFIKIQTLRKHQAEIWCLSVSSNGKYLVTASHDKSVRLYRKTEEILVPTEEEEAEREYEDEVNVFEKQENIIIGEVSLETGFASKMTIETVKSADRLIEAIDVFESERAKEQEFLRQSELADSRGEPRPAKPDPNPLLMTTMSTDYRRFMLETLRRVRSSELEEILLTLPFDYVKKLLSIMVMFLERHWDIELMVRCATFLLKTNFGRIAASPMLVPIVHSLNSVILAKSFHLRDCAGFNLAALQHLGGDRKYLSTKINRVAYDHSTKLL